MLLEGKFTFLTVWTEFKYSVRFALSQVEFPTKFLDIGYSCELSINVKKRELYCCTNIKRSNHFETSEDIYSEDILCQIIFW